MAASTNADDIAPPRRVPGRVHLIPENIFLEEFFPLKAFRTKRFCR